MNETLSQRIRLCAERAGSGEALARGSGIPRRTLETYLSGQAEPKASRLAAIARAAGVSVHWLATGEGPMAPSDETGGLLPLPRLEASGGAEIREETPLYGNGDLALGSSLLRDLGLSGQPLAAHRVEDDTMAPTLQPGDLVVVALIDPAADEPPPLREGIHLVNLSGRLHLKRLQADARGGLLLRCDNPAYETLHLDAHEAAELEILGRAVWYGRALP